VGFEDGSELAIAAWVWLNPDLVTLEYIALCKELIFKKIAGTMWVLLVTVNYPAHRAGHLKTILAAWGISLVRDGTECIF
jgi:hypothetical protein